MWSIFLDILEPRIRFLRQIQKAEIQSFQQKKSGLWRLLDYRFLEYPRILCTFLIIWITLSIVPLHVLISQFIHSNVHVIVRVSETCVATKLEAIFVSLSPVSPTFTDLIRNWIKCLEYLRISCKWSIYTTPDAPWKTRYLA